LQGVVAAQLAPIVSTVFEMRDAFKSPNWLAIAAPEPPPDDPELCTVHALAEPQPYRFAPATASDLKNNCPTWQVDGRLVPI